MTKIQSNAEEIHLLQDIIATELDANCGNELHYVSRNNSGNTVIEMANGSRFEVTVRAIPTAESEVA